MVELVGLTADTAGRRAEDWRDVYNECFTAPPWNEPAKDLGAYTAHLERHLAYGGFTAHEAYADGGLVGVGYGWPTPADLSHPFHRAMLDGLTGARDLLTSSAFEIAELMIRPAHRGNGIGRLLLDELCTGYTRSWLATMPDSPAARFYTRLGWTSPGTFVADDQAWQVFEHRTDWSRSAAVSE